MNKIYISISFTLLFTSYVFAFELINRYDTDDCVISIVTNEFKERYALKQIKNKTPDEQFLLVLDTTACHIAQECNIPINRVILIPADTPMPEKYFAELPMTQHSFAEGVSLNIGNPYSWLSIHQRFSKKNSAKWKRWGPLSAEQTGLTRTIISHMLVHPDLPKIAALDTFVGNADRSAPNLFYDETTDSFCGIDMAGSFNSLLAQEACRQIELLLTNQILLSRDEVMGLELYLKTLQELMQKYPPEKIIHVLQNYAQQAGFLPGSVLYDEDVRHRIIYHERNIERNYSDCKKLIHLLEKYLSFMAQ